MLTSTSTASSFWLKLAHKQVLVEAIRPLVTIKYIAELLATISASNCSSALSRACRWAQTERREGPPSSQGHNYNRQPFRLLKWLAVVASAISWPLDQPDASRSSEIELNVEIRVVKWWTDHWQLKWMKIPKYSQSAAMFALKVRGAPLPSSGRSVNCVPLTVWNKNKRAVCYGAHLFLEGV